MCCPQQGGLAVNLWRATYFLGNGVSCLGIAIGTFWPTQSWYWTLCLVTGEDQLELCLSHYLETSLGPPSYIIGSFHCTKCSFHPSNAPSSLAYSPLIPSLHPILPPSSCLTLPCPSQSTYPPQKIQEPPSVLSPMPNFLMSVYGL